MGLLMLELRICELCGVWAAIQSQFRSHLHFYWFLLIRFKQKRKYFIASMNSSLQYIIRLRQMEIPVPY